MAGLSNYMRNRIWNRILRGPAAPSVRPSAVYAALFTTLPDDDDAGGVEPVGNGYDRTLVAQVDGSWDAAVSGLIANLINIDIGPAIGGDFGKILGAGFFDALTGGNYLGGYPLISADDIRFFAVDGNDKLRIKTQPFTEPDPVFLFGSPLPAPLLEGVEYYVLDEENDKIKLSLTPGGAKITFTGIEGGIIARSTALTILDGQSFRFKPGDFSLAIVR